MGTLFFKPRNISTACLARTLLAASDIRPPDRDYPRVQLKGRSVPFGRTLVCRTYVVVYTCKQDQQRNKVLGPCEPIESRDSSTP